jgi:hypothetical protein
MSAVDLKPTRYRSRSKLAQAKRTLPLWSKRNYDAIDGRLVEAKVERQIIGELTNHVGGFPTAPQRLLIKRTARLVVMLGIIERRIIESCDLKDLEARQLCALSNSLRLNLQALGLAKPEVQAPNLVEYLGARKPAA